MFISILIIIASILLGLFVLAQMRDGEYACDYYTPDAGDMRLQLGTEIMGIELP